jgi:hypothetical protein
MGTGITLDRITLHDGLAPVRGQDHPYFSTRARRFFDSAKPISGWGKMAADLEAVSVSVSFENPAMLLWTWLNASWLGT